MICFCIPLKSLVRLAILLVPFLDSKLSKFAGCFQKELLSFINQPDIIPSKCVSLHSFLLEETGKIFYEQGFSL